jgi:hypothetical protein
MIKSTKIIVLSVIIFILSIISVLLFLQNTKLNGVINEKVPQNIENPTDAEVISMVSKYINISASDNPKVGTINDITTLKKQNADFFGNARNGDKIVIFGNKTLIYRVEEGKIINFSSLVTTK